MVVGQCCSYRKAREVSDNIFFGVPLGRFILRNFPLTNFLKSYIPRNHYQESTNIFSPLYVYSSTFTHEPSNEDLVGILSIILWTLTLMVTVRYSYSMKRIFD